MEQSELFNKNGRGRITSPDQLDEYLHVTTPTVWIVLAAVVILLAGMMVWSSAAVINSYVTGTGNVKDGEMTVYFDKSSMVSNVKRGMTIDVEGDKPEISAVDRDQDDQIFALADTVLEDGSYDVRVYYDSTKMLNFLFN